MASARKRWLTEGLELGPDRSSTESTPSTRKFPISEIQIATQELQSGDRQQSAGWLGSVLLHLAIVVLITFLFAPADFGGVSTQTLIMSFNHDQADISIPMMLVDEVAPEDSSLLSEEEMELEQIEPVEIDFKIGAPSIKVGGAKSKLGRSTGDVGGGSSGSFFGIEAVGQEFVYIVDRSGSMNGARYRRAIQELKRSIDELREDQRFFVILFSSSSIPMALPASRGSSMMAATTENKKKLEEWLQPIEPGGGTKPNSSLRTALKMNPSAIFMLSDGEFTESKSRKRSGVLLAGGTAHSIAQASGGAVPIHAIAFEDPRSCRNMQQLAEITGGEYRFINSSGKTEAQLLAQAKQLLSQPKSKSRRGIQYALSRDFAVPQVSGNAKREFTNLLVDAYESSHGKIDVRVSKGLAADLGETVLLLETLVTIDPGRVACADQQDAVAGELARLLDHSSNRSAVEGVCDQVVRWRGSTAMDRVLGRLLKHFESLKGDNPNAAFARLKMAKRFHKDSAIVTVCQDLCDQITIELFGQVDQFLVQGDVASAIKALRQLESDQQSDVLKNLAWRALHDLTMDQFVAGRNASFQRDADEKLRVAKELADGFEDDPRLGQWRKEFVNREMAARRILRQVESSRLHVALELKRQRLTTIIQQFPETVAAKRATELLSQLPKWKESMVEGQAELIRLMDDTPRQ